MVICVKKFLVKTEKTEDLWLNVNLRKCHNYNCHERTVIKYHIQRDQQ
jgi:hypothetical protein